MLVKDAAEVKANRLCVAAVVALEQLVAAAHGVPLYFVKDQGQIFCPVVGQLDRAAGA